MKTKGKPDVPQPLPIHFATLRRAGLGGGPLARRSHATGAGPAPLPRRTGDGGLGRRRQRRGEIGAAETLPARIARAAVAAGLSALDASLGGRAAETAG